MANEITLNLGLRAAKDGVEIVRQINGLNRDWATAGYSANVQTISNTAHEALGVGADVATAGYCWLRNLDEDHYIDVGLDVSATFYGLVRLGPGEAALLPVSTTSLYARAQTGTGTSPAKLEFIVLAD